MNMKTAIRICFATAVVSEVSAFAPIYSATSSNAGVATCRFAFNNPDNTSFEDSDFENNANPRPSYPLNNDPNNYSNFENTNSPRTTFNNPNDSFFDNPNAITLSGANNRYNRESRLGPTLNGWTPDEYSPCYGLPGAIEPLGYFDPFGFCNNLDVMNVKLMREAEIMHGRVAMLAAVGFLIQENTPTIAFGVKHKVIAIDMIEKLPNKSLLFPLFLLINFFEATRAIKGWVPPEKELFALRRTYYPGDIGFDPMGLRPSSNDGFEDMHIRELSNGRLAMIAVAGMCAQELVNHKPILPASFIIGK